MTLDAFTLRLLTSDDRPVVERLWQLYAHDLSEARGTLPNSEGLYKSGRLAAYFDDPDRQGYLVEHDDAPIGFAFVKGLAGDIRGIGDFFVVRAMRRRRIGYRVAHQLLIQYPGRWEIAFQAENAGAPEFWRLVVSDVVSTRWREELRPVSDKPQIPPDHWLVFSVPDR